MGRGKIQTVALGSEEKTTTENTEGTENVGGIIMGGAGWRGMWGMGLAWWSSFSLPIDSIKNVFQLSAAAGMD